MLSRSTVLLHGDNVSIKDAEIYTPDFPATQPGRQAIMVVGDNFNLENSIVYGNSFEQALKLKNNEIEVIESYDGIYVNNKFDTNIFPSKKKLNSSGDSVDAYQKNYNFSNNEFRYMKFILASGAGLDAISSDNLIINNNLFYKSALLLNSNAMTIGHLKIPVGFPRLTNNIFEEGLKSKTSYIDGDRIVDPYESNGRPFYIRVILPNQSTFSNQQLDWYKSVLDSNNKMN
jgi:hypothetical protein